VKRGRKPIIDTLFDILKRKKEDIFDSGNLSTPSHEIWDDIIKELNYAIPKKNYIHISFTRQKRHQK